eukprot:NODE_953_length_2919_cov_1.032979.p1 type:complete len:791 gc:universal NODE_953_length_2919_cov_1.032979:440-2812(+)
MYALLISFLVAVSIDCPIIIQLALDLDIKYTNTDYFIQYEKDCCLGVGVICENERVTELHWGFVSDYSKPTYPEIQLPPKLRVLDMTHSQKTMILKKLPESLKVIDFYNSFQHALELQTLPNLTYFKYHCYYDLRPPILPRLPDTLEFIDFAYCAIDIFPSNATGLKEIHYNDCNSDVPYLFPNIPETIESVDLRSCNYFGQIALDFKHVKYLSLGYNHFSGNLTVSSPNITTLDIRFSYFDRLFISNVNQIDSSACSTSNNYFEPDNANELAILQSRGCHINYKSAPSPDCPNLMLLLRQLNMHLVNPERYNYLANLKNCCEDVTERIYCTGSRIDYLDLSYLSLNGTINSTLLPYSLFNLNMENNNISGYFPDLSSLLNCITIDLRNNQIQGTIYGKLPNTIQQLYISDNQLNGTIPLLSQLTDLAADNNNFDSVENQLTGNILQSISISFNKIRGIIDMSYYVPRLNYGFNFRNNLIDKILTLKNITNSGCDVSLNNIAQADLRNLTSCKHELQIYSDPINFESCKYAMNLLRKMGEIVKSEKNCCDSFYGFDCVNQNVTGMDIWGTGTPLLTVDGFTFSAADIPPSLQMIFFDCLFNQTAQLPSIPGHVKYIQIKYTNIGGKLPVFSEGLETLIINHVNLNQSFPTLPSTLKILRLTYCNLFGRVPELPPNLQELQIQGNNLTGPLPLFPASLKILVLGDIAHDGNIFNDKLTLQNPTRLVLGDTGIYDVQLKNTSLLTNCDLSFSPLQNNTNIANYTMCKKYYLKNMPENLTQNTVTQDSKSSIF